MKKIIDVKTGKKITVFNKYKLDGLTFCPECKRPLDDNDKFLIENYGQRRCKKCGSYLEK